MMLYHGLKAGNVFQLSKKTWWFIARLIFSAIVMALVVYYLSPAFEFWLSLNFIEQVVKLIICITAGMLSYFVCLLLLGIRISDIKIS
jgi:putative peptidoglycan lipid II flippase